MNDTRGYLEPHPKLVWRGREQTYPVLGGYARMAGHVERVRDCLYALQPTIAYFTRSTLHRCLQRHGISRLPDTGGDKPQRSKFKRYPIGYFHIDIAEVRTEQGKLHLFVAIGRTSKFAFVELHEKATRCVASNFLRALAMAVPYKIHTVLTDNGTHFTEPRGDGWTPEDIRPPCRAARAPSAPAW